MRNVFIFLAVFFAVLAFAAEGFLSFDTLAFTFAFTGAFALAALDFTVFLADFDFFIY